MWKEHKAAILAATAVISLAGAAIYVFSRGASGDKPLPVEPKNEPAIVPQPIQIPEPLPLKPLTEPEQCQWSWPSGRALGIGVGILWIILDEIRLYKEKRKINIRKL